MVFTFGNPELLNKKKKRLHCNGYIIIEFCKYYLGIKCYATTKNLVARDLEVSLLLELQGCPPMILPCAITPPFTMLQKVLFFLYWSLSLRYVPTITAWFELLQKEILKLHMDSNFYMPQISNAAIQDGTSVVPLALSHAI